MQLRDVAKSIAGFYLENFQKVSWKNLEYFEKNPLYIITPIT